MKKITILSLLSFLFTPNVLFAATPANFKEFIELLLKILQNAIQILVAGMAIGLLYGVAMYMVNSDNEKKREDIKGYLLYGVMGLFVVVGLWGILALLSGGAVGIPLLSPPT